MRALIELKTEFIDLITSLLIISVWLWPPMFGIDRCARECASFMSSKLAFSYMYCLLSFIIYYLHVFNPV